MKEEDVRGNESIDESINNAREPAAGKSRRDFVKLAGKVAIYTPPVMAGLAAPSVQAISKSAIGAYRHSRKHGGPRPTKIGGRRPMPKRTGFFRRFLSRIRSWRR